jgi:hypothetical protein
VRRLESPLTRVAKLDDEGGRLPLPTWSLRLGRTPATVRYLFLGYPDFRHTRAPWRYVERMGAFHRLEADGVRVTVVAHKRGWLTEASLVVERDAAT